MWNLAYSQIDVQSVSQQLCCVIWALARTVSQGQEQGQGLHSTALQHQTQPLGLMAAAQTACGTRGQAWVRRGRWEDPCKS